MHLYLSRRRENFQKKDLLVLTATWAQSVMETRLTPIFTNKFSRFISVHFVLKNQINALSQRRYTFDPFFLDAVMTFIEENYYQSLLGFERLTASEHMGCHGNCTLKTMETPSKGSKHCSETTCPPPPPPLVAPLEF